MPRLKMEFAEGRIIKTASRDRQMSVASDDWEEVGGGRGIECDEAASPGESSGAVPRRPTCSDGPASRRGGDDGADVRRRRTAPRPLRLLPGRRSARPQVPFRRPFPNPDAVRVWINYVPNYQSQCLECQVLQWVGRLGWMAHSRQSVHWSGLVGSSRKRLKEGVSHARSPPNSHPRSKWTLWVGSSKPPTNSDSSPSSPLPNFQVCGWRLDHQSPSELIREFAGLFFSVPPVI